MIRATLLALAMALALVGTTGGAVVAQTMSSGTVAVLRGLDKLSGTTTDIEIAVGAIGSFARLRITLVGCRYPTDNPNADAIAFLDIHDNRNEARLFRGWMIGSAPALNALDDARYDVWVLTCR
jgi:hypothetical protein